MIELLPNIYYLPGENKSRFPYCACLYVKGQNRRVLIDAGMGAGNMAPVKKMGIDLLLLTHCHIDHRLTRSEIPQVPVWCHEKEAPFLRDKDRFFSAMGLKRSGLDLTRLFDNIHGIFDIQISHTLVDGERIDLGGLTLVTLHTPGHAPGHVSFYIPEANLLFTGDIDLTPFGPFYGHDFADIGQFIQSIEKLRRLDAKIVATGHAGPYKSEIANLFDAYEKVIYHRDELVLSHLNQPRSLEYFIAKNLIFRVYQDYPDLLMWFERVHIEKHLKRLAIMGKVYEDAGRWIRLSQCFSVQG